MKSTIIDTQSLNKSNGQNCLKEPQKTKPHKSRSKNLKNALVSVLKKKALPEVNFKGKVKHSPQNPANKRKKTLMKVKEVF